MSDVNEILTAFEQTLELERELGTRTVECDRALLAPVPPPAPRKQPAAVQTQPRQAAPAPEAAAPKTAREVDILFMVEAPASAAADEMLANMIAATGYERSQVCVEVAASPSPVLSSVRPKCAVLMGASVSRRLFPGAAVRRGAWLVWNGVPAVATLHPNEILRCGAQGVRSAKLEVWNALKLVLARLGKTPPAVNKKG